MGEEHSNWERERESEREREKEGGVVVLGCCRQHRSSAAVLKLRSLHFLYANAIDASMEQSGSLFVVTQIIN